MDETTIAALATAPVPAGVAVVRISGPDTRAVVHKVFRGKHSPTGAPRELLFGTFVDSASGERIDSGLAVFMPGPASFTGEDVAEFQCHGSPVLVKKLLRAIYACGVLPAPAGEFTRRAFLNGKLDLAQAEAIADVVHSKGEEELRFAEEQLHGRLSSVLSEIGEPLRDTLAEIEASIDFPEEDINPDALEILKKRAESGLERIEGMLATYDFGSLVRDGVRVLLCGRPNSGKSSLLNRLLGKERAIVSDISGTTRDLIEDHATIDGHSFIFCDSAGIRETEDHVEKIGVELAKERLSWADIVLFVVDVTDGEQALLEETLTTLRKESDRVWLVLNKVDLSSGEDKHESSLSARCASTRRLSAKTGEGIEDLMDELVSHIERAAPAHGDTGETITNERHRDCLRRAANSLRECGVLLGTQGVPLSIVGTEVKQALEALDEIVGKTYTEDILGRIFSKFCIGK
jgi:tRNA modification GTPase